MPNNVCAVMPIGPFDHSFSYLSDVKLEAGEVVGIPFGNRKIVGMVVKEAVDTTRELKKISKTFGVNVGSVYCDFLDWVASYTLIPKGNVLKMILAEKSVFSPLRKNSGIFDAVSEAPEASEAQAETPTSAMELSPEQREAYEGISANGQRPFLLHGVTGSGKTEIYLSAIADVLKNGRQALILLPEIALTSQLSQRIEKYFGFTPSVWNSNITPKNRRFVWSGALAGRIRLVIGARSALFLPFKSLGIIVVDEEHDPSYKQEDGGSYNARDMAVVLGRITHIPIVLSSATPSLESYINAQEGKYGYALVKNKFGASPPPHIELVDMRQNKFNGFISPILLSSIRKTIEKNEQCLIYLNRRGYSPVTLCKSCGAKISCPNCSGWLVYHKNIARLLCHYCGHKIPVPHTCPHCKEIDSYIPFGPGVERIFDELSEKIPDARIVIASSDTVSSNKNIFELLEKIHNNSVNIIIGTQILTKGHHFPNITLVGIVDGDLGLHGADLRASERTYQMIKQVSGRAGRAEKQGKIMIQTFNPDHSLYRALQSDSHENFVNLEISSRKENDLPPFSRFAALVVSGTNRELTEKTAMDLVKSCPRGGITVLGPAPAPIFLLRGRVRWRILLKNSKKFFMSKIIKEWLASQNTPKNVKIYVDVDPISFL
jgi:primosomal protein N' (replication factor Y)